MYVYTYERSIATGFVLSVRAMKCNRLVIHWARTYVFGTTINIATFSNYGRYHNNQYLVDTWPQNTEHTIDAVKFVHLLIGLRPVIREFYVLCIWFVWIFITHFLIYS